MPPVEVVPVMLKAAVKRRPVVPTGRGFPVSMTDRCMVSGVSVAEAHVDPCIRIPPMHFARITLVGITVPIKSASYGLSFETSLTLRVMSNPLIVSVLLITIGTLSNTLGVMTGPLKTGAGARQ